MSELRPEDLRLRAAQWRLAAERERELRRAEGPLAPDEAFARAIELIALADATQASDPVRERGVEHARQQWALLRSVLRSAT